MYIKINDLTVIIHASSVSRVNVQAQRLFEKIRSQKKQELEHSKYYSYCICSTSAIMHLYYFYVQDVYIDLTVGDTSKKPKKISKWTPDLDLTMFDKQSLLDPVGWMTDTIINAAQILIKQQFPHIQSLQDVALGQTMSFHVQMGEFLQIIYSSNHWFTISSIGVTVIPL